MALPGLHRYADPIDPPTVSMLFGVNDSPLAGRDGKQLTSTVISDRLAKEAETNVAINIQNAPAVPGMSDALEVRRCRLLAAALHSLTCITGPGRRFRVFQVQGRGEMQVRMS